MRKILLIILMCSSLSGCGLLQPVNQPETHSYQIGVVSADSSGCSTTTNTMGAIQIEQMHALSPYDSKKMFYSTTDYELSPYSYHQWVADPSQMLTQAVVENLLQSCIFSNVFGAGVMSIAKYRLASSLLQLNQRINGDKSIVNLVVLVQLIDNTSNKVMRSKTFVENIEANPSPGGFITGINQATQKFLTELRSWIVLKD